jgi:hypothetical protein
VDVEALDRSNPDVSAALTASERALLAALGSASAPNEWPTRVRCAKVAVAKALGIGWVGGLQALVAETVDPETGTVRIGFSGPPAHRAGGRVDLPQNLDAATAREGRLVIAVSCLITGMENLRDETQP